MRGGTTEKLVKSRTLNGALWRYLKRCFGSWNSGKNLRKNTLNGAFFFNLIFLKTRSLNDALCRNLKRCFGSWNCWEPPPPPKKKPRSLNGAFCRSLKRWKCGTDLSLSNVRAPISFSRDVFVSYTMLHWN